MPEPIRASAIFLREQAGEFLWSGKEPGRPFNLRNFRRHFMEAVEGIEGVRPLTPHSCRHTYITYLQTLGVDVETIRSIVGHADIDMTAHYIHVQEQTRQQAVAQLGNALGGAKDAPPRLWLAKGIPARKKKEKGRDDLAR